MKKIYIFSIALIIILSSCGSFNTLSKAKTTPFAIQEVRLELRASDFELLGETEVTYSFRSYLGVFRTLDSLNNQAVNLRSIEKVKLKGDQDLALSNFGKRAAVKILKEYPEADYYVPSYTKEEITKMFLGRKVNTTIKLKAYKLKLN